MIHQRITLPESHPDYPCVWQSEFGRWRVIRCVDDIQYIVQQYRSPKWRSKSYHRDWYSIEKRLRCNTLNKYRCVYQLLCICDCEVPEVKCSSANQD